MTKINSIKRMAGGGVWITSGLCKVTLSGVLS
jgi:hypothetical protein